MSVFKRMEVAEKIKETGVVPVFYHSEFDVACEVVKACYDGGVGIIEFTNRGDFAHEVFAKLRKYTINEMPGFVLGVGSVIDAQTAVLYMQNGADFIVSPTVNDDEIAKVCNRRKVLWIPGCGSVTEVSRAHELGAEIIKIFPGKQVGGPAFVKSVLGPMPWTDIMPTGGVDTSKENLEKWFDAGVCCVGMGSNLITTKIIENKEFYKIKEKVEDLISILKNIR